MSEVNEILKQLKAHCPGEAFHAGNKTHAELIANRFMDFTATLIGEIETLTEDLDTSEAACADLMTLNDKLTGERDEWKNNHADMVKRNAELRDRPDLGDRCRSVDKLYTERDNWHRTSNTFERMYDDKQVAWISVKKDRDRLRDALIESVALNENWVGVAEVDMLEHLSEYRVVIKQSKQAIKATK